MTCTSSRQSASTSLKSLLSGSAGGGTFGFQRQDISHLRSFFVFLQQQQRQESPCTTACRSLPPLLLSSVRLNDASSMQQALFALYQDAEPTLCDVLVEYVNTLTLPDPHATPERRPLCPGTLEHKIRRLQNFLKFALKSHSDDADVHAVSAAAPAHLKSINLLERHHPIWSKLYHAVHAVHQGSRKKAKGSALAAAPSTLTSGPSPADPPGPTAPTAIPPAVPSVIRPSTHSAFVPCGRHASCKLIPVTMMPMQVVMWPCFGLPHPRSAGSPPPSATLPTFETSGTLLGASSGYALQDQQQQQQQQGKDHAEQQQQQQGEEGQQQEQQGQRHCPAEELRPLKRRHSSIEDAQLPQPCHASGATSDPPGAAAFASASQLATHRIFRPVARAATAVPIAAAAAAAAAGAHAYMASCIMQAYPQSSCAASSFLPAIHLAGCSNPGSSSNPALGPAFVKHPTGTPAAAAAAAATATALAPIPPSDVQQQQQLCGSGSEEHLNAVHPVHAAAEAAAAVASSDTATDNADSHGCSSDKCAPGMPGDASGSCESSASICAAHAAVAPLPLGVSANRPSAAALRRPCLPGPDVKDLLPLPLELLLRAKVHAGGSGFALPHAQLQHIRHAAAALASSELQHQGQWCGTALHKHLEAGIWSVVSGSAGVKDVPSASAGGERRGAVCEATVRHNLPEPYLRPSGNCVPKHPTATRKPRAVRL